MSPETTLAFLLDSPLQSWGSSSRFQRRGTDSYPSKSGVLGLIAAAMGIDKHRADEPGKLAPLAALRFSVYSLQRAMGKDEFTVQRLEDYHTVGGGYDEDTDPWARLSTPRKASGGPFGTVLTQRDYLADAVFAAVLQGPREMLGTIASALQNPVWGVWLGRKACIPSTPIVAALADSSSEALEKLLTKERELWPEKLPITLKAPKRLTQELEPGETAAPQNGADACADQPISYGQRRYHTRTLRR